MHVHYTVISLLDVDPEDYFMNHTLNMSAMAVSSDSDMEDEVQKRRHGNT